MELSSVSLIGSQKQFDADLTLSEAGSGSRNRVTCKRDISAGFQLSFVFENTPSMDTPVNAKTDEDRSDISYVEFTGVSILGMFSNTNAKLETCTDISFRIRSDTIPGFRSRL